jgi:hypothetical protein
MKYVSTNSLPVIWKAEIRTRFIESEPTSAVDLDPDLHLLWWAGSGSRWAKMTHKKKVKMCCCSRSLEVLHGGLGLNNLSFLIKNYEFFQL